MWAVGDEVGLVGVDEDRLVVEVVAARDDVADPVPFPEHLLVVFEAVEVAKDADVHSVLF